MTHRRLSLTGALTALGLSISLAATAAAAPITLTAELDPGQTGPTYSWSLRIQTDPGFEVGGIIVVTTGFDSFVYNVGGPPPVISFPDSYFAALGDGRSVLSINSPAIGIPLAPSGFPVLLGHFVSTFNRAADVSFLDCEAECGGTVFAASTYLPYPAGQFELRLVPEASDWALVGLALLFAGAARALAPRVTPGERGCAPARF